MAIGAVAEWRKAGGPLWRGSVVPGTGRWPLIVGGVAFMLFARGPLDLNRFTWFDSRVSNFFEMEGVGESGASYRVDARFFAPYDIVTRQSRFYFLYDGPVLAGTYAVVHDRGLFEAIQGAAVEQLPSLRRRFGVRHYDREAATRFGHSLRTFMVNAMERGHRRWPPLVPKPPYHFQASMSPDTYRFQEPVDELRIFFEEWFRTPDGPRRTRRELVLTVPLEGAPVVHGEVRGEAEP